MRALKRILRNVGGAERQSNSYPIEDRLHV